MPMMPAKQATPTKQATKPATAARVAPSGGDDEAARKKAAADEAFRRTKPNAARDYINAIAPGESANYILKVNRVVQQWAQPKAVADDRPQPTALEMKNSKPTFSKQDAYAVEVEVLATDHPGVKPGSMKSFVFLDKYPDSYKSCIMGFLSAATGDEPEDIGIDDWAASYSNEEPTVQPLMGAVFHANASQKKAGGFTTITCRALTDEERAEYAPAN